MLRTVTQFALLLGLVGTASAQTTEIIIRRSGQKDQVIKIDDKQAKEMAAKVSEQLKGAMKNLKEVEVAREGNVTHFSFDSGRIAEQVKMLSGHLSELAAQDIELSTRAGALSSLQPGMMARVIKGALTQPRLGIYIDNSRPQDSDKYGALVSAVTPGGPADKAGIRSGDIITKVDGKSLASTDGDKTGTERVSLPGMRLIEIVTKLQAGKSVEVEYRRGTTPHTVKVTPVEEEDITITSIPATGLLRVDSLRGRTMLSLNRPQWSVDRSAEDLARSAEGLTQGMSVFGNTMPGGNFAYAFSAGGPLSHLELVSLNEKLGAYFGTTDGVLVVNVGDKDAFGLLPGDVIASVDGRKVTTSTQLMRILRTYDKGEEFKIQIMRQKKAETLTGKLP